MTVTILRTNGETETHDIPRRDASFTIARLIGAHDCDIVNLRDGRVMIIDDAGYDTHDTIVDDPWIVGTTVVNVQRIVKTPVRALKPVNVAATKLYHAICKPGTTHQIVGDAAIAWDRDFA